MFADRKEAALLLAAKLEKYRGQQAIVLGIPRGGVETGYYIARHLNAGFSLLVVRKLGHPHDPEFAFGAMAEDGTIYFTPHARKKISQEMMDRIEDQEQREIERRVRVLRKGMPLPEIRDKTVIITDDGIATGATVVAAIRMCKKQRARKIIVAAPVSSAAVAGKLEEEANEVVILQKLEFFLSVSQAYEKFENLEDKEVLGFLEKSLSFNNPV